jgi:3-deoxy-7-phosphoheptulonate synthase
LKHSPTIVKVGDVEIGGDEIVVMAGPCAIENEENYVSTAIRVKQAGVCMLI